MVPSGNRGEAAFGAPAALIASAAPGNGGHAHAPAEAEATGSSPLTLDMAAAPNDAGELLVAGI